MAGVSSSVGAGVVVSAAGPVRVSGAVSGGVVCASPTPGSVHIRMSSNNVRMDPHSMELSLTYDTREGSR